MPRVSSAKLRGVYLNDQFNIMTEQLTKTVTICNQTLYLLCEESMIMIRFDTVPERDGRTDGQNCYIISISRVITLTRDKKRKKAEPGVRNCNHVYEEKP